MSLSEQHNFSASRTDQNDPATSKEPNILGLNVAAMGLEAQSTYAARLNDLIAAHDDLDMAVASLLSTPGHDELVVSRLKKRKLHLKDEISHARTHLQDFAERGA